MNTKMILVNDQKNIDEVMQEAGAVIKAGGLVAFPTETVYGLGGDALNEASSEKIYRAKGRPSDNPLIVHISRWEDLLLITREVPPLAKQLSDAFWPGPFTMVLKKSDRVPLTTTGGLDTVAVRMPGHQAALAFIKAAGGFVAAPSANTSGKPSPTLAQHVWEDMNGKIEMILDGGAVGIGVESTILDLTGEVPVILRPGSVTEQMIREVSGKVETDQALSSTDSEEPPKAPGMKYRHYAPKGRMTILSGDSSQVMEEINRRLKADREAGEKTGVIAAEESASRYHADVVKSAGARGDEGAAARQLYRILREFDEDGVTVIYSEAFSSNGIGQAVMNRLLKAAGHHIEYLNEE